MKGKSEQITTPAFCSQNALEFNDFTSFYYACAQRTPLLGGGQYSYAKLEEVYNKSAEHADRRRQVTLMEPFLGPLVGQCGHHAIAFHTQVALRKKRSAPLRSQHSSSSSRRGPALAPELGLNTYLPSGARARMLRSPLFRKHNWKQRKHIQRKNKVHTVTERTIT